MHTVLIAEDQVGIQKLIAKIIESQGCRAIFSSTAHEALTTAKKSRPDAIFLDLGLPDRSGLDVLKALKLEFRTRHIPVVAMTDHGIQANRAQCLRFGFSEYITKPVTKGELYTALQVVTGSGISG